MPFTIAAPAWLLGGVALGIPIALHLWSRRPSQVVRLGSLVHLQGAPGPRAWGRQLDDIPLLAIRLAVLATCVLALAGVRCHAEGGGSPDPEFLVVADPALALDSLELFSDPLVDSIRRAGTPIRVLRPGLPLLGSTGEGMPPGAAPSLWSMLAEWDAAAPPGSSVLVVARPRAGALGPVRPAMISTVRWHAPPALRREPMASGTWNVTGDTAVRVLSGEEGNRLRQSFDLSASIGTVGDAGGTGQLGWSDTGTRLNSHSVVFLRTQVIAGQEDSTVVQSIVAAASAAMIGSQGLAPAPAVGTAYAAGEDPGGADLIIWLNGQSVLHPHQIQDLLRPDAWIIEFIPLDPPQSTVTALTRRAAEPIPEWATPLPDSTPGASLRGSGPADRWVSVASHRSGRWYRIGVDRAHLAAMAGDTTLPTLFAEIFSPGTPASASPVSASQATPARRIAGQGPASAGTSLAQPLLALAALLLAGERLLAHARPRGGR